MNTEQTQIHLIKTIIQLKKVAITVRFPCSISFALKYQNNLVDHKGVYQLVKGQSIINQSIQIQIEVAFARGRYEQKKLSLLIFMVSANGRIPAGTVTLNPTQKIIIDKKSPLEKCPDKNAQVTFTESYEKIRILKQFTENKMTRTNLAASTVSGFNYLNKSQVQYASTSSLFRQDRENQFKQNDNDNKKGQFEYNLHLNSDQRSLRNSRAGSQSEKKNFTKFSKNRIEDATKRNYYGTSEKDNTQMRMSRASNQVAEGLQWQVQSQKSKILKLQQEKTGYIKQLAKLKGSMVRVESQERFQIEDQYHRIKDKKSELQDEVQKLKEKNKFQQKKDRQSGSLLKELRDELDKKKSRIIQLDSTKNQIQGRLAEKDRVINTLQTQKRKLQQSLQQQKALQQSFQKRLELKQNSYKEQLKKINDKYSQSEAERQKAMLDYNSLLLQMQNSEKKNQTLLRQKEKSSNEEKSKLNKKFQQQLIEITELQQKLSDKINMIRDYEYYKKKSEQEQKQKAEKYHELKEKYDDLLLQNKNIQEEKKNLQAELKNLQVSFNEDKINYKKKYLDSSNELAALKDKLEKSSISNNNLQVKIKDLQSRLDKQIKEKNSINNKLEQLKKVQQKYLEEEQNRQRLAQTLSMSNIAQNNKLSEFKSRLQAQRKKYEVMETKYEEQVQYLVKSKDYLQNQIQELKWMLQKEAQKYQTLSIKHRELNDHVIDLNQQIIRSQQKFAAFEHQRNEYSHKIQSLELEITHLQNKHKSLSDNLKKKQEEYYSIQKKGSNYEQQLFLLQNKLNSTIRDLNDKVGNLERSIEMKECQLKEKDQQFIFMNEELSASKAQLTIQKNQINNKNAEILTLKQLNTSVQEDLSSLLSRIEKLKAQINEKQQMYEELQGRLKAIHQQSQLAQLQHGKDKQSFEQYKSTNKKVLEQLFHYLKKEECSQNKKQHSSLELLPDQHLSKLQSECTTKIYNNNQRQQQTIKELTLTITHLEEDIKKLKFQIQILHQKHEKSINMQVQSQKIIKSEKDQQISTLNERINELNILCDEKANEIQFLSSSVSKYEDMISQFTEEAIHAHKKENQFKIQINQLEKQLYQYREKEIKSKLLSSTESQQLKHLFKEEKQRHQDEVRNLRDIVQGKDKQINEKIQEIKKWILIESQQKLQQVKYVEQIKELNQKISKEVTSNKTLQKTIQEKQKIILDAQEQISNQKAYLSLQRNKQKQNQVQTKRLQGQIHTLQQKSKNLVQQHQQKYGTLQQSQRKQKQKREKLQVLKSKLQQENKEVKQKCVKFESQIEFYKFYKEQSSKKLSEYEKIKEDSFMEMMKCRQNIIRSQKQLGNFENKHYKLQMQIEHLTKQKDLIAQTNNKLRLRLEEYEQKSHTFSQTMNELQSRDKQLARLQQNIKAAQLQNQKIYSQLKNNTNKLKEQLTIKTNKIKELQKIIDDRNTDINVERQKIQIQFENEKNMYQIKIQTYVQNMRVQEEELQFHKQQATKQIQGANLIIQELNEVIRQKQQALQYSQEIINEQNVRLQELNLQLVDCVNKWQKEKEIYMPASARITEISEQLTRMNKFISQLDGRNKQLLQVNKRKMQQTLENKPSITEILKEFYIIMQKSKNKILNRCQTEKEKETVMLQFKAVQQKLDLTLKSTQIVSVKQ